jgi:hypothetical protein
MVSDRTATTASAAPARSATASAVGLGNTVSAAGTCHRRPCLVNCAVTCMGIGIVHTPGLVLITTKHRRIWGPYICTSIRSPTQAASAASAAALGAASAAAGAGAALAAGRRAALPGSLGADVSAKGGRAACRGQATRRQGPGRAQPLEVWSALPASPWPAPGQAQTQETAGTECMI